MLCSKLNLAIHGSELRVGAISAGQVGGLLQHVVEDEKKQTDDLRFVSPRPLPMSMAS